jgi:hypothetical protein
VYFDDLLLAGAGAVVLWVLLGAMRTGEFRNYERVGGMQSRLTRVRRDSNPEGFWILVAGHISALVGLAWWAFTS